MMQFIWDDGGRSEAGYTGTTGDCTVRAIAIATGKPYREVYDQLFDLNRRANPQGKQSPRSGNTSMKTIRAYMADLGWHWIATMKIGSGCKVHLRADELPAGRLIVRVSKHLVAVVDGTIYDIADPSRGGTRCVYGFFCQ